MWSRNHRLIGRGVSLLLVFIMLAALSWLALRPVQAGSNPAPLRQDRAAVHRIRV